MMPSISRVPTIINFLSWIRKKVREPRTLGEFKEVLTALMSDSYTFYACPSPLHKEIVRTLEEEMNTTIASLVLNNPNSKELGHQTTEVLIRLNRWHQGFLKTSQ